MDTVNTMGSFLLGGGRKSLSQLTTDWAYFSAATRK